MLGRCKAGYFLVLAEVTLVSVFLSVCCLCVVWFGVVQIVLEAADTHSMLSSGVELFNGVTVLVHCTEDDPGSAGVLPCALLRLEGSMTSSQPATVLFSMIPRVMFAVSRLDHVSPVRVLWSMVLMPNFDLDMVPLMKSDVLGALFGVHERMSAGVGGDREDWRCVEQWWYLSRVLVRLTTAVASSKNPRQRAVLHGFIPKVIGVVKAHWETPWYVVETCVDLLMVPGVETVLLRSDVLPLLLACVSTPRSSLAVSSCSTSCSAPTVSVSSCSVSEPSSALDGKPCVTTTAVAIGSALSAALQSPRHTFAGLRSDVGHGRVSGELDDACVMSSIVADVVERVNENVLWRVLDRVSTAALSIPLRDGNTSKRGCGIGMSDALTALASSVVEAVRSGAGRDVSVLRTCLRVLLMLFGADSSKSVRLRLLRNSFGDVSVALNTPVGVLKQTALMEAVVDRRLWMVSALMQFPGVDVDVRDFSGRTAYDLARHEGDAGLMACTATVGGACTGVVRVLKAIVVGDSGAGKSELLKSLPGACTTKVSGGGVDGDGFVSGGTQSEWFYVMASARESLQSLYPPWVTATVSRDASGAVQGADVVYVLATELASDPSLYAIHQPFLPRQRVFVVVFSVVWSHDRITESVMSWVRCLIGLGDGDVRVVLVGTHSDECSGDVAQSAMSCGRRAYDRACGVAAAAATATGTGGVLRSRLVSDVCVGRGVGGGNVEGVVDALSGAVCNGGDGQLDEPLDVTVVVPRRWQELVRAVVRDQRSGVGLFSMSLLMWHEFVSACGSIVDGMRLVDVEADARRVASFLDAIGAAVYKGRTTVIPAVTGPWVSASLGDDFIVLRPQVPLSLRPWLGD